jgi:hypothetical protein
VIFVLEIVLLAKEILTIVCLAKWDSFTMVLAILFAHKELILINFSKYALLAIQIVPTVQDLSIPNVFLVGTKTYSRVVSLV